MKSFILGALVFVVGVAAGVGGAIYYVWNFDPPESKKTPLAPPSTEIVAQGRLLPANGLLSLGGTPGDRVVDLKVKPGQKVEATDELAKLLSYELHAMKVAGLEEQKKDANDKLKIEQKTAEFQLKKANLAVEHAKNQEKLLEGAQQQIDLLEKQRMLELNKLQKIRKLRDENPRLVTESQVESQQLLTDKLAIDIESAKLELRNKTQAAAAAVESAEQDQQAAQEKVKMVDASHLIAALQKQIDAAKMQQEQSILRSPIDGTVLKIFVQQGDTIAQTPVLQVADLSNIHCVVEVYESERKNIKIGNPVTLTSKALPMTKKAPTVLKGRVARIGQSVGTPGLAAAGPFAAADTKTVEVIVELKGPSIPWIQDYINLQIEAAIDTTKTIP